MLCPRINVPKCRPGRSRLLRFHPAGMDPKGPSCENVGGGCHESPVCSWPVMVKVVGYCPRCFGARGGGRGGGRGGKNPGRFYGRGQGLGKRPAEQPARLDRFLAATLAFGHTGFLVMRGGMPSAVRSYFSVQLCADSAVTVAPAAPFGPKPLGCGVTCKGPPGYDDFPSGGLSSVSQTAVETFEPENAARKKRYRRAVPTHAEQVLGLWRRTDLRDGS